MHPIRDPRYPTILIILVLFISGPMLLPSAEGSIPTSRSADLLCRYDLCEGEGQYTMDVSGNGNDAVLGLSTSEDKQDPSWDAGLHDSALRFDGVDDLLNCGNGSSLQVGKGSFTVEAWVHVGSNLTDNLGGILHKYDRTADRGFFLDAVSTQRYGGTGDSYSQVIFGMNQGRKNNTWNVAAGSYGTSHSLNDMVIYDGGLFAASSQGDLVEWTPTGWVQRAAAYSNGAISSLAVYDGRIFGAVASTGELVRKDGSTWTRVAQSYNSELVNCLAVFNGMLYGGSASTGLLLEWNGFGAWALVASPYSTETGITDLCVYNNNLFGISSPSGYLLQWNGRDSWAQQAQYGSALGPLIVYRGRLYSGYNSLLEWNGVNNWLAKSSTIPSGIFTTMTVFGGELLGATNAGVLYEWDGDNIWVQRAPISGSESTINAMCAFRGKLYGVTTGQGLLLEWNSGFSVTGDTGLYPGWNHIVAVKDSSAGAMHLYINGEPAGTSRLFDPDMYDLNCTTNLYIGQGSQDNFKGSIDRVRIFGRALGGQEIAEEFDFFSMEWRKPLPPTSPGILSGDLFVNLTWGPPISLGTHPLLGYRIYKGDRIENITLFNDTVPGSGWFNDTEVSYGVTYHYMITAYSEAGESLSEDLLEATPMGKPTPPVNLTVHSGDRFVNISWKPPLMNKGSNITGYRLERGLDLSSYYDLIQLGPNKRYYNDTIVDNRQTYYYRIFARNEIGESLPSSNVSAVPKKTPPPVNSLAYEPIDQGAALSWNRCTDPYFHHFNVYRGTRDLISGGLMGRYYNEVDFTNLSFENQDYVVDFDWGTGPPIPRMEDSNFSIRWDGFLKAAITGSYTIIIRADGGVRVWIDNIPLIDVWKDGWHESLTASVYLINGEHQIKIEYFNQEDRAAIRLSWAPPDMETQTIPTSSLFGYYIEYELVQMTPELSYTDEELQIGRYYYYHVKAVNDAGESPLGNVIEVYVIGIPGEPRNFVLRIGDGYVNLSWEQPIELKGSRIAEYRIFRANGTDMVQFYGNVSGDTLHFNDTSVVNGLDYFYYVTAVNDAGESAPSTSLKGIPVGKPSPPRTPKAELYEGGVKVTWASPKFNGGADLMGFNVYRSVNGGNRTFVYWENDFMVQGYIDHDVSGGNTYEYWITALNEVGESEFSDNVSISLPAPPVVDDDDDDDDVEPVGNESKFPFGWVITTVVVLLIAAAAVAFLIIRGRKRSEQELMIGPVSAETGMPMPMAGGDDTFDIFHPGGQPTPLSQVMEEVYHSELPHQELPEQQPAAPAYDQHGSPQEGYPQQGYPQDQYYDQHGYPQEGYPPQGYPQDQYYDQQGYPQEGYPQGQYYDQQGYQEGQGYYSEQPPQQYPEGYYEQGGPPAQEEVPGGPINEFFAAPPPESLEGQADAPQEIGADTRPTLPGVEEEEQ
ncbi:MAG: PA14 domain-containing protein [Thermoplasmatota archaeon]